VPQEQKSCPHCGQPAPIINRGVLSYCTACGQPRAPFSATSVTLAGQPSKLGGTVAAIMGWLVLGGGMLIAVTVGLLLQALFPAAIAGYGIGGMIALVSFGIGLALLLSGRSLRRLGTRAAQDVRDQAILALAAHKGGILTARDVSLALGDSVPQADALLTDMTKRGDQAVLEMDNDGRLTYRFPNVLPPVQQRWPAGETLNVPPAADAPRTDVRVGDATVENATAAEADADVPARTRAR
jgi:hypothetical protein